MTERDPRATRDEYFFGAFTYERYLARVEKALEPLGFDRDNAFAAVSVCRDELTQSILQAVAHRWDEPFDLGGLGGLPSLGRTGWRAALSHVPVDDERGRLIVFGFPHIGIAPDGTIGASLRRRQRQLTATCGAMAALFDSLSTPSEPAPPELGDTEFDRLARIVDTDTPTPSSLVELTLLAAAAVEREIWLELDALGAHREMDIAVLAGIQIHLPDDVDYIHPTGASVMGPDGERRPLTI